MRCPYCRDPHCQRPAHRYAAGWGITTAAERTATWETMAPEERDEMRRVLRDDARSVAWAYVIAVPAWFVLSAAWTAGEVAGLWDGGIAVLKALLG